MKNGYLLSCAATPDEHLVAQEYARVAVTGGRSALSVQPFELPSTQIETEHGLPGFGWVLGVATEYQHVVVLKNCRVSPSFGRPQQFLFLEQKAASLEVLHLILQINYYNVWGVSAI